MAVVCLFITRLALMVSVLLLLRLASQTSRSKLIPMPLFVILIICCIDFLSATVVLLIPDSLCMAILAVCLQLLMTFLTLLVVPSCVSLSFLLRKRRNIIMIIVFGFLAACVTAFGLSLSLLRMWFLLILSLMK